MGDGEMAKFNGIWVNRDGMGDGGRASLKGYGGWEG